MVPEPTVAAKAARRADARDHPSGTPPTPSSSPSGSRFSVPEEVPLDHLAQVTVDCGIAFRGERGPRLEQIAAIKAKEVYEGALAASRAQAERVKEGPWSRLDLCRWHRAPVLPPPCRLVRLHLLRPPGRGGRGVGLPRFRPSLRRVVGIAWHPVRGPPIV